MKDPLVLSLDGAAPTLSKGRFAFDLDADGNGWIDAADVGVGALYLGRVGTPFALGDEDFQQLETVLADLAERGEGIPTGWEYCDGFLTALVCCRRVIPPSEYFPVLFGGDGAPGFGNAPFRDEAQAQTFLSLWFRRWNQIAAALAAPVELLDDTRRCWTTTPARPPSTPSPTTGRRR